MDAYDWWRVEQVKIKLDENGINITPSREGFLLQYENKNLGIQPTVEAVYAFLCGFEWGRGIGYAEGFADRSAKGEEDGHEEP